MPNVSKQLRLLLVLLASIAAVAVATGVAAPLATLAKSAAVEFGFVHVRSGIPEGTMRFALSSPDLPDNKRFPQSEIANVFGCHGGNQAPRLHWSGAPAGTKSFVVTMFDPDAPTGSGFWHWLTWDIPSGTTSLNAASLPAGAVAGTNDAGLIGYLGPCPPPGDRTHRYQLTVYALRVSTLNLTPGTRAAVVAFSMRLSILGFGRMIGTFSQPAM